MKQVRPVYPDGVNDTRMVHCKPCGLSRKERITNGGEFERAYKNGAISKSGCLIIRALPNNLGYSRLGIAVSKKLFPSSVTRNRIRRLIREAFRLNKHQLPKGMDLIIGVRHNEPKSFTLPAVQSGLMKVFIGQPPPG